MPFTNFAENGEQKSRKIPSRFRPRHCTAKPASLHWRQAVASAVALPPHPRPQSRNRSRNVFSKGGRRCQWERGIADRAQRRSICRESPLTKAGAFTLTRRVAVQKNGNPATRRVGRVPEGNTSGNAPLRAKLARSDYRSTSLLFRLIGRSASSFSGGLRKTESRKSFTSRGACFTASRNNFVSFMSRSQRDL